MLPADWENLLPLLVNSVFGNKAQITRSTILNELDDYLVMAVDLASPSLKIVVKLAGPGAPILCPFDRTATILKQVATHTNIAIPEIYSVDVTYQAWPWRYLIMDFMEGEEWSTALDLMSLVEKQDAYAQLGDAVGQLHGIHYPSFGDISIQTASSRKVSFIQAWKDRASSMIKSPRSRDLFLSILDRESHLFEAIRQPGLCHDDLHRHNILFERRPEGWKLKTILDFDKAWASSPESDLARLILWKGMTSPEFWTAYGRRQVIDDGFPLRQPVYQLAWCLEFARPTEEHLTDTRRICHALGIHFSGLF